jgi:hypothetical protein
MQNVFDFPRPRPPKRLVQLRLDDGLVRLIDRWRAGKRIPRTRAIRALLCLALAGEMLDKSQP